VDSLLGRLRALNAQRSSIRADIEGAGKELARVTSEAAGLRSRLGERDLELAVSGSPLPSEPLPEELALRQAERVLRVAKARVGLYAGQLTACEAEISGLKPELEAAWQRFGNERYQEARLRLREAAMPLAPVFAELMAYWHLTGSAGKEQPPRVIVQNPGATTGLEPYIIHSERQSLLSHSEQIVPEVCSGLRALRAEIEQAKG